MVNSALGMPGRPKASPTHRAITEDLRRWGRPVIPLSAMIAVVQRQFRRQGPDQLWMIVEGVAHGAQGVRQVCAIAERTRPG